MSVQLEFNFHEKSEEDQALDLLQNQIDSLNESVGKVRRKLFAELGDLKKEVLALKEENERLSSHLRALGQGNLDWMQKEPEIFAV